MARPGTQVALRPGGGVFRATRPASSACWAENSARAGITLEALSCMTELPVDAPGDYARPGRPWCRVRRPHGGSGKNRRAIGERPPGAGTRSVEHTSELQSLMRNSYAVFCLKQNNSKK